jgi:hypothetical protein
VSKLILNEKETDKTEVSIDSSVEQIVTIDIVDGGEQKNIEKIQEEIGDVSALHDETEKPSNAVLDDTENEESMTELKETNVQLSLQHSESTYDSNLEEFQERLDTISNNVLKVAVASSFSSKNEEQDKKEFMEEKQSMNVEVTSSNSLVGDIVEDNKGKAGLNEELLEKEFSLSHEDKECRENFEEDSVQCAETVEDSKSDNLDLSIRIGLGNEDVTNFEQENNFEKENNMKGENSETFKEPASDSAASEPSYALSSNDTKEKFGLPVEFKTNDCEFTNTSAETESNSALTSSKKKTDSSEVDKETTQCVTETESSEAEDKHEDSHSETIYDVMKTEQEKEYCEENLDITDKKGNQNTEEMESQTTDLISSQINLEILNSKMDEDKAELAQNNTENCSLESGQKEIEEIGEILGFDNDYSETLLTQGSLQEVEEIGEINGSDQNKCELHVKDTNTKTKDNEAKGTEDNDGIGNLNNSFKSELEDATANLAEEKSDTSKLDEIKCSISQTVQEKSIEEESSLLVDAFELVTCDLDEQGNETAENDQTDQNIKQLKNVPVSEFQSLVSHIVALNTDSVGEQSEECDIKEKVSLDIVDTGMSHNERNKDMLSDSDKFVPQDDTDLNDPLLNQPNNLTFKGEHFPKLSQLLMNYILILTLICTGVISVAIPNFEEL